MKQYGVHINGYVREASGEIKMWIGKRSDNKQTYPGLLDNMVRVVFNWLQLLGLQYISILA